MVESVGEEMVGLDGYLTCLLALGEEPEACRVAYPALEIYRIIFHYQLIEFNSKVGFGIRTATVTSVTPVVRGKSGA